ncbi:energy-coupling factor ABC transporter ATP-binding protein [Cohnella sp. WQ 127256]|uniref:energy-coupling factor ABC transporter ATP-binding protein n=1 Tax=Cohnella sp. WQ 127256 TaxID=2938790 RepID=UPI002118751D|nr:ABC transporter ATP-binding protein [Cohnella sp. WQ 127256]
MELQAKVPMVLNRVSLSGQNELGEPSVRLEDINLTVTPGEWLSIVGVNGSGKSTLARLLAGLQLEHSVGEITRGFAGEGICPIVLQQPRAQLFGETPREEVIFALEWRGMAADQIPLLGEQALSKVGLTELADDPWEKLSGGQQQLAAIAAATACETPLLVLDEVTSMLDEMNRDIVMRTARELHKRGMTIIWVTQRLDELEPDTRVVALGEGRVIFDGECREFLYGVSVPGEPAPLSPCLRVGLRLPYLAAMALELRLLGKLEDPLPLTAQEWRKVWGNAGDKG